jgi:hypothetical protein
LCKQVACEVNSLLADFLAIATQVLVNAKYGGSQIQSCVYPAQKGIGAGFHCLTGKAIATQQRSAFLGIQFGLAEIIFLESKSPAAAAARPKDPLCRAHPTPLPARSR